MALDQDSMAPCHQPNIAAFAKVIRNAGRGAITDENTIAGMLLNRPRGRQPFRGKYREAEDSGYYLPGREPAEKALYEGKKSGIQKRKCGCVYGPLKRMNAALGKEHQQARQQAPEFWDKEK